MSSHTTSSTMYQSEPQRLARSQRPAWIISSVFVAGIVACLLFVGRAEISKWYAASALNAIADERYSDAVEASNNGLEWAPDYLELVKLRALAHLEQQDFESCLADYDQILEMAKRDEKVTEADIVPLIGKSNVLQRMGRFDDSIALWNEVVKFREDQYRLRDDSESRYEYSMSLNNRAYIEAQAKARGSVNVDIGKSLEDVQRAINIRGVKDDSMMIDTLGYLLLLDGQNQDALNQLEKAVKKAKLENERIRNKRELESRGTVDLLRFEPTSEQLAQLLDQQYSVILHHRGEAYAALGKPEKAKADFDEAIRLGYNPDEGIW